MAKRKFPVPVDHRATVSAIKELPDLSVLLWTNPQQMALENRKEYWRLIGRRIDYFQLKACGYNPPDPLEERELHSGWKEWIKTLSAYDFATLNLMINQFNAIKSAAIKDGRGFPFDSPRELFTERCRELANSEVVEEIGSNKANQGTALTKQRSGLAELDAFFKGRLDKAGKDKPLSEFRSHKEWCVFWMFPVWQVRWGTQAARLEPQAAKQFMYCWSGFLDAFWDVRQLIKKKSELATAGATLLGAKWSFGYVFDPKTGRALSPLPIYKT